VNKDPLALALASPDPAIRKLAARRQALGEEISKLDGFFANYAALPRDSTVLRMVRVRTMRAPSPRSTGDFVAMARATLREAGRALGLSEFYDLFWARVPEQTPTTKDSFRQQLVAVREHIAHHKDIRGYWIAGETPPTEHLRAVG
jgi:hypothetical protein